MLRVRGSWSVVGVIALSAAVIATIEPTLALAAAGFLSIAFSQHLWLIIVGLVLIGASIAFFSAPSSTLIGVQGIQTSPPALGGAYSLYNLAYAVGLMVGPFFAGALVSAFGASSAFITLAAATVIVCTVALLKLPCAVKQAKRHTSEPGASKPALC